MKKAKALAMLWFIVSVPVTLATWVLEDCSLALAAGVTQILVLSIMLFMLGLLKFIKLAEEAWS